MRQTERVSFFFFGAGGRHALNRAFAEIVRVRGCSSSLLLSMGGRGIYENPLDPFKTVLLFSVSQGACDSLPGLRAPGT